jgi:ligand-binding sensor domain-containing protein/signal transduction histidine kinase
MGRLGNTISDAPFRSSGPWPCKLLFHGLVLSALLLVDSSHALAPDPKLRLSEFVQTRLDLDDGLPQNTVMALAQDANGFIWLGTFEGIANFDGQQFRRFTLEGTDGINRSVTQIVFSQDGSMWVGTQHAGVFRVFPDGRFESLSRAEGLPTDRIRKLYIDRQDRLWIGTHEGVCVWQSSSLDCNGSRWGVPWAKPVTGVTQTPDGSLWFGITGVGLVNHDGVDSRFWDEAGGKSLLNIAEITSGRDGRVWVGTFGQGLIEFDQGNFIAWDSEQGLAADLVGTLMVDEAGALWVGTYGAGMQRLYDGVLETLASDTGRPNSHIQSVMVDQEGSLWFGTSGGVSRLTQGKFSTLSTAEGLSASFVRAVAEDRNGGMWVGTDGGGVNLVENGEVIRVLRQAEIHSDSVRSVWPAADGGIWIGAFGGGLTRIGPQGNSRYYGADDGLSSLTIRALFEDSGGSLWIGGEGSGLDRLDADGFQNFSIADGLPPTGVRAITEAADGSIWFGTYGNGLARYINGAFETIEAMPEGIVFAIRFDIDGSAWIGTDNGLANIDIDGSIKRYPGIPQLGFAMFQILIDDDHQNLWLCTNHGVLSVRREDLLSDKPDPHIDLHDSGDGLRSRQCNGASQPAGWHAADGSLWFPTADGVSWIHPGNIPSNEIVPPVRMVSIKIDDQNIALPLADELVLQPHDRHLELGFAALTFIAPDQVTFRYRLLGLHDRWLETSDRREAVYHNLPPGEFIFQVIAANADGIWNTVGSELPITKFPYYYQTHWFKVLVVAGGLLVLTLAVRRRNLMQTRQRRRLEKMVTERTTDLEQTLGTLQTTQAQLVEAEKMAALGALVSGVAHELNTPVGNGVTVASHLMDQCRDLAEHVDNDETRDRLEAQSKGLAVILGNLERAGSVIKSFKEVAVSKEQSTRRTFFLSQVLNKAVLNYTPQVQNLGHTMEVHCPESLQLDSYPKAVFDLFSHLTANSLAHAFGKNPGSITIDVKDGGDQVVIEYADNGPGFDDETRTRLFEPFFTRRRGGGHAGLGLHIVFNIVTRLLGGDISSPPGNGARFFVRLPKKAP